MGGGRKVDFDLAVLVGVIGLFACFFTWGITMKTIEHWIRQEACKSGAGEYRADPMTGETKWVWKSEKGGTP